MLFTTETSTAKIRCICVVSEHHHREGAQQFPAQSLRRQPGIRVWSRDLYNPLKTFSPNVSFNTFQHSSHSSNWAELRCALRPTLQGPNVNLWNTRGIQRVCAWSDVNLCQFASRHFQAVSNHRSRPPRRPAAPLLPHPAHVSPCQGKDNKDIP